MRNLLGAPLRKAILSSYARPSSCEWICHIGVQGPNQQGLSPWQRVYLSRPLPTLRDLGLRSSESSVKAFFTTSRFKVPPKWSNLAKYLMNSNILRPYWPWYTIGLLRHGISEILEELHEAKLIDDLKWNCTTWRNLLKNVLIPIVKNFKLHSLETAFSTSTASFEAIETSS